MAPDVPTANNVRVCENGSCVGDKACDTVHTNKPQYGSVTAHGEMKTQKMRPPCCLPCGGTNLPVM